MMLAPDATTPDQPDETSPRYAGWRVVLACFLLALFVFGFALYGQGVYLVELQRLNGWSTSLIAGASTISLLLGNMLVAFTSEFVTRLGLKRLVLLGIAALAGSMALLAFASAPWLLYAAFMLMSLGWTGMGTVVIATVVGLWFVKRRGLAISLAFTGASAGGIVITPLLVLLVEQVGFQAAVLTAAAIMVAILLPVVIVWVDPPPTAGPADGRKDDSLRRKAGSEIDGMSRLTLMRQPAFWTIAIPFALALMAQVGFIVHQIALLEPKIGHVRAGFAVALMTFMAVAGRLGLGLVIDRFNPRRVTAALLVSQAAALLTVLLTDNMPTILAACAVFGVSVGNLITLPPLIIHREFDAASFAIATGLSTAISGTVCALGPGLIGLVRGWSGDYDAALLVCIVLELAAAAIVARPGFLTPQRRAGSGSAAGGHTK